MDLIEALLLITVSGLMISLKPTMRDYLWQQDPNTMIKCTSTIVLENKCLIMHGRDITAACLHMARLGVESLTR